MFKKFNALKIYVMSNGRFLLVVFLCLCAVAVGCRRDDNISSSPTLASRCNDEFTVPPRFDTVHYLDFIALGDTGKGDAAQYAIAADMARYAAVNNVSFTLLLGDNFYPSGVNTLEDPRFETYFEQAYKGASLKIPFYVVAGNHDYRGDVFVQVAYSAHSDRWVMPALYYTFSITYSPLQTVQFFALDTDPIATWQDARDQIQWLENQLDLSQARWKIVYGHNPVYSNGLHGNCTHMIEAVLPLLEKYGVDLYLSGHDHDLQILKPVTLNGPHFVVSGAGSEGRNVSCKVNTVYCSDGPGFMGLRLSQDQLVISVVTKGGKLDYCHVIEK